MQALHSKTALIVCAAAGAFFAGISAVAAVVIPLGAGWEAAVPDDGPVVSIVPGAVGTQFIFLSIMPTFSVTPPPGGTFAPSNIVFRQIAGDAESAPYFYVLESVHNATTAPWSAYQIDILAGGSAWLRPSISVQGNPLTTRTYVDEFGFGDPSRMSGLRFSGGVVLPGQNFSMSPIGGGRTGGYQLIETDLSGDAPLEFTLRQFPTPEPAMIGLGLGIAMLFVGRRFFLRR